MLNDGATEASALTIGAACILCGANGAKQIWAKDGYQIVECQSCGLVFVGNPPSEEELRRHYSFGAGYHEALREEGPQVREHREEALANYRALSRASSPGLLLDIGCSTGLFLEVARSQGWQVRGLEYSADAARVAREKSGLPVDTGDLATVAYDNDHFDVVSMWDVIEHLRDPVQSAASVWKLLRPGGIFILKTPNIAGLFPRLSRFVADWVEFWPHPEPPGHLYQFSVTTITRLLREQGFEVVSVHHEVIPIRYTFGPLGSWARSGKWLAYCCMFAPIALLGPWVRSGDAVTVVARK